MYFAVFCLLTKVWVLPWSVTMNATVITFGFLRVEQIDLLHSRYICRVKSREYLKCCTRPFFCTRRLDQPVDIRRI